jgi:hypothetical protein
MQIHMRLAEKTNANLSDGLYHWQEMRRRIALLGGSIITPTVKALLLAAIDARWEKIYTPNMALAAMLDPRRGFAPDNIDLSHVNILPDALSCLKARIVVFSQEKQKRLLASYNGLIGTGRRDGSVFKFHDADASTLAEANNMPLWKWWQTYRTDAVAELSVDVAERLFVLSLTQADVERANGMCSRLQEGRAAMLSETARKWAYIYINVRALKQFHELQRTEYVAGTFAIGYGWPPIASNLNVIADEDARAEGPEREVNVLRYALARLEAEDSEDEDGGKPPPAKRKRCTSAAARRAEAQTSDGEEEDDGEDEDD